MQRTLILALVSALALVSWAGPGWGEETAPGLWGPFHGRVADHVTGQPITGAAVIVAWSFMDPSDHKVYQEAAVAVTDQEGRFELARREPPPNFGRDTTTVGLACVAPGYEVVLKNNPVAAADHLLSPKPRHLMLREYCLSAPAYRFLSDDQLRPLAQQVNEERARMGLEPIDLHTGEPTRLGGKVSCPKADKKENVWGPFRGRVVDAETGEPIAGAAVVVHWMQDIPNPVHPMQQFYDVRWDVTKPNGRFDIARRKPPFFTSLFWRGTFFTCVAPGYLPYELTPSYFPKYEDDRLRVGLSEVRLRKRPQMGRLERLRTYADFASIPDEKLNELTGAINRTRQRMGLRPFDLITGELE